MDRLPARIVALRHGADLVWGPETVDRKVLESRREVSRSNCINFIKNVNNSIVYRILPSEKSRHIFQLGSASPSLAVAAAKIVAADVAGVDLNCGCPKGFSVKGGMGAALLQNVSLLEDILRALVAEIGQVYNIGISCKIRLLATQEDTESLTERLCQTGISALTVHCRTTPMRNSEPALHERIRCVVEICKRHNIPCYLNGDVDDRVSAEQLIAEYGVDGAMIARAAQSNLSCFRHGGCLDPVDVARHVLQVVN